MGTNFYVDNHGRSDNPKWHLGKRSAAGLYCWDCNMTLCKDGEKYIHYSNHEWYEACPKCGKEPMEEGWNGSAGRELGFNSEPFQKKTGVASCSSFTWARKLGKVQKIEDEYSRKYTRKEFEEMLEECPVQYYNLLGQAFS